MSERRRERGKQRDTRSSYKLGPTLFVTDSRFSVLEWQTVTVALFQVSRSAIGVPCSVVTHAPHTHTLNHPYKSATGVMYAIHTHREINRRSQYTTILLRPRTTASFPLTSQPHLRMSSRHPRGVHGITQPSMSPLASFPPLTSVNPSTS